MEPNPDLQFDEASHTYRVAGLVYPGVTKILDPINILDGIPPDILAAAADLGRKVHKATHLDDCGQLSVCDTVLMPYVTAWRLYLHDTRATVIASERRVIHRKLRYCGTLDKILRFPRVKRKATVDIKTALCVPRTVGAQVEAYERALRDEGYDFDGKSDRICVTLYPDGTYEQTKLTRDNDWTLFVSALNIYRFKTERPRFTN